MGDQATFLAEFDRVLRDQFHGDLNSPGTCADCSQPGIVRDMVLLIGTDNLPTRVVCQACATEDDKESSDAP